MAFYYLRLLWRKNGQWVALPLAIHGVIAKKDGTKL